MSERTEHGQPIEVIQGPTFLPSPERLHETSPNYDRPRLPVVIFRSEIDHDQEECPPCPLCNGPRMKQYEEQERWAKQSIVIMTDIPTFYCSPCDYVMPTIDGQIGFLEQAASITRITDDTFEIQAIEQELFAAKKIKQLLEENEGI